jgi:type III restriction enzyme
MAFAHWRKCDFQVHTPRDPNWTGARPLGLGEVIAATGAKATAQDVDAARAAWAKEFVDQCLAKGLEAIALTDHHEMVIVPYVQQEIAARQKADPAFDLWLFPGMELTANGGRQCLIIFDADLSEDWRRQAQGKLGIVYADLEEKSAKGPSVTQLTSNYADIGALLDSLGDGLKGRYIVLPNVSQGNRHTVLKDGAHADFRRMPYVGGYLDSGQTLGSLSAKNQQRLSGEDKNWSVREIYRDKADPGVAGGRALRHRPRRRLRVCRTPLQEPLPCRPHHHRHAVEWLDLLRAEEPEEGQADCGESDPRL